MTRVHCPECATYHPPGEHWPLWECMSLDEWRDNGHEGSDGRDGIMIRGFDPETAAERWAEHGWEDDPPGDGDQVECVVLVEGKPHAFRCRASFSVDVFVDSLPDSEVDR
jgi:hypothetical protein